MDNASPEAYGESLRARATHAKNTCERKGQVSRVDATCWYLSNVSHASSREVKRFISAFKGNKHTFTRWRRQADGTFASRTWEGPEPAYSMLNTAYGGVGMNFNGDVRPCRTGTHYGPVAPLYRPIPRHYANTVAGLRRASRVQAFLDV